jgi:hypothetical protein
MYYIIAGLSQKGRDWTFPNFVRWRKKFERHGNPTGDCGDFGTPANAADKTLSATTIATSIHSRKDDQQIHQNTSVKKGR